MQGRSSNQQVLERNLDALALLLGVDSPRQKRDWLRERIDWNIGQQFLDERFAPGADLRRIRAVDSVDELDQSNSRKRCLLVAHHGQDPLQQLRHRLAFSFGRD
jgi:hypothetical protein